MALSDTKLRTLKAGNKAFSESDGGGLFVEVMPGQEGLVHISELSETRVNKTEDVVKRGEEIWVKCIGIDDKGRVKLSRRAALRDMQGDNAENAPAEA